MKTNYMPCRIDITELVRHLGSETSSFDCECEVGGGICNSCFVRARALELGDLFLLEHPADEDEAIDEAWMRSIGGTQEGAGVVFKLPDGVSWWPRQLTVSCYHDGPPRAYLEMHRTNHDREVIPLGDASTRGQVLRLLRALGIETPEGGDN